MNSKSTQRCSRWNKWIWTKFTNN